MNDVAKTKDQLDTMFNSGTGFDEATLDSSGKKVGNKLFFTCCLCNSEASI